MRDAYVAQPSRLIVPEDEKAMVNKLLHDPRGERLARRRSVGSKSDQPSAAAPVTDAGSREGWAADEPQEAAIVKDVKLQENAVPNLPVLMPAREDRQAVWGRLDAEGNGALSFDKIERAVAELLGDRVWHEGTCLRALARAAHAVKLNLDGWVQRNEFTSLLQHFVYFANCSHQLERAEVECQKQQGRLTPAEFLRAAAAAGASVNKATATEAFRAMAANEGTCTEKSVSFDDFCRWCAQCHISQVR